MQVAFKRKKKEGENEGRNEKEREKGIIAGGRVTAF